MGNDTLNILVLILAIVVVVFIFIRIAINLRKYGGSLTTTMHASTFEFLNKDKRNAIEEIAEMKSNKKLEEEESDKPITDQ